MSLPPFRQGFGPICSRLTRMQIIGAPAFFPTVWGWIKRWFDPVTTSKIFILSAAEVKPTLTSFMDPSSIPKQYGGDLDWKWGDMPFLDDEARKFVGALETPPAEGETRPSFTKGPVLFKGDRIEILGKVNGESRKKSIPVPAVGETPPNAAEATPEAAAETGSSSEGTMPAENEKLELNAEKVANGDSAPQQQQSVSA